MKRLLNILPLIICVIGTGIIVFVIKEHWESKQEDASEYVKPLPATAPDAETFSPQDRKLAGQVFDNPGLLDSRSTPASSAIAIHDKDARPPMMSAQFKGIEKDDAEPKQVQQLSPFVESFVSLRTDAMHNPDSEQNKAVVKSIMGKRQRRVAELGID